MNDALTKSMSVRGLLILGTGMAVLMSTVEPAIAEKRKRGGRIDVARQRVRANKQKSSRPTSERRNSRDSQDSDDDRYSDSDFLNHGSYPDWVDGPIANEIGEMALQTVAFPFSLPALALGDHPFRLGTYRFVAYPYAGGQSGHTRRVGSDLGRDWGKRAQRVVSLRLQSSYERHADNLNGVRLRGTLRTAARFNIEASVTRYAEELEFSTDTLWHYKVLGMYSFAVSPRAHFSAGVGVRSLVFRGGEDAIGVIGRYSAEFFPASPFHIWVSGEIGGGRGGGMAELEMGVGLLHNQIEVYAGYRAFKVAGVPFSGPQLGVMLWL